MSITTLPNPDRRDEHDAMVKRFRVCTTPFVQQMFKATTTETWTTQKEDFRTDEFSSAITVHVRRGTWDQDGGWRVKRV